MATFKHSQNFTEGVNLDLDELRLPANAAAFIKNITFNVNTNPNASGLAGSNKLVGTPMEGNVLLGVTTTTGINYCVGFYSSEQTNEGYFFLWNSDNNHSIWVIDGNDGQVRKVYQGAMLPFVADPKYYVSEGRVTLELRSYINPVSQLEENFKFLIFTTNAGAQIFISVEDSIATDSFSTAFFTSSAAFYEPLELISLGVPTPLKNIGINTPVAYVPVPDDLKKQNLLIRNGWQWRIKFIDVFGRESEHGIISDNYISLVGGGCLATSNSLARCVMLNFDAGNPMVNQICVEYRRWVGNDRGGSLNTGWLTYEVFNKYNNIPGVQWYERSINPLFTTTGSGVTINTGTNTISYTFCADKSSIPIDVEETSRTEPGVARISSSIGSINKRLFTANNVHGFDNVDPEEVSKVQFGVQLPSNTDYCPAPPVRKIQFLANIYPVAGDGVLSSIISTDTPSGRAYFGSIDIDKGGCAGGGAFQLGQTFGDKENPGFIGYMAGVSGGSYACISEQVDFNPLDGTYVVKGCDSTITRSSFTHIPAQLFTMYVPAGRYVIRIASHRSTITSNFAATSTNVAGLVPASDMLVLYGRLSYAENPAKEMIIDCTSGDVIMLDSSSNVFLIIDLTACSSMDGYLKETLDTGTPVEMNPVWFQGSSAIGTPFPAYGSFFTDHNGFYFAGAPGIVNGSINIKIFADLCDGEGVKQRQNLTTEKGFYGIKHGDGTGTGECREMGNWQNSVYLTTGEFNPSARRKVIQPFGLCSNHATGVPGIPGILQNSGSSSSGSDGILTITAHNRYVYSTVFGSLALPILATTIPSSFGFVEYIIYSQRGGCNWTVCGGLCTPSISYNTQVFYLPCFEEDRNTVLPRVDVNVVGVNQFGIQSGGRYPVSFWLHDYLGRHTAAQPCGFVDVPALNSTDTPYPLFKLCKLKVTMDPSVQFDPTFTKMTFLVGPNVIFNDYFSWSADWVQYVDNTGNTNESSPTAIRIYYNSLNEYQKQYNFGVNCNWQFISETTNGTMLGDIVEFICDGYGRFLPEGLSAQVTYDASGSYFTVPYSSELSGLTNGCLFRVVRPNQNTSSDNTPQYEQSLTVELTDGVPPLFEYILPYFDSYLLTRLIPVPVMKNEPGPIAPGAPPTHDIETTSTNLNAEIAEKGYSTNNVNNNNGVIVFQARDSQTAFPFFFEGPSPSDFWGSHLSDRGRIGAPNPYAQQQRIGTEVALSAALGDRGTFNGLSYFESKNTEIFDRNTFGNITVMLVEVGKCLVICDSDHFFTSYNSTQLKVVGGNVISQNNYGIFTSPERKAGSISGCAPFNINTIRRYNGMVVWLDTKYKLIFNNFSVAQQVETMGYEGYLYNKISTANIRNLSKLVNEITYFTGSIDPLTNQYLLTSFHIPDYNLDTASYINTNTQPTLLSNETMVFDLSTGKLSAFTSFTPEYMGLMPGYYLQKQFLSFKNGIPYIHHQNRISGTSRPYMEFYGTQCDARITAVVNLQSDKVKRFLWNEVYCKQNIPGASGTLPTTLFIADVITTEKGQVSRLLIPKWDIRDGYSAAYYLCDLNTPADPNIPVQTGVHAITDGNPLIGRWMKVSYVTQPGYAGTYFEISEIDNYGNGVQKSGGDSK